MTRKQQRLYAVLLILLGITVSVALALTALRSKVTYFYTPSDIAIEKPASDRPFRLGGMVETGSLTKDGLKTNFTITDYKASTKVRYEGIVPSLFREGQGVIATGHLNADGTFTADQLLAKHDENYMPPEVKRALERNNP